MITPTTTDALIEEMLEFGMPLDLAEHTAPLLLPLVNDPRGFRQALLEDEPWIAEQIGAAWRH